MKKLIVLCIAMAFGMIAMARVVPPIGKPGIIKEHQMKDCYLMKDGKVWEVKDNKSTPLDEEVTLKNGTKVKPEGTVITKSGEITILNEGDKLYADGQIEKAVDKKEMGKNYKDYDTIYRK